MYTIFYTLSILSVHLKCVITGETSSNLLVTTGKDDDDFVKKTETRTPEIVNPLQFKNTSQSHLKQRISRDDNESVKKTKGSKSAHLSKFNTTQRNHLKGKLGGIAIDSKIKPPYHHLKDFLRQSSSNYNPMISSTEQLTPRKRVIPVQLYLRHFIEDHRIFRTYSDVTKTKKQPQTTNSKHHILLRRNAIFDEHARGEEMSKTSFVFSVFGLVFCFVLMVVLIVLYWSKKYFPQGCFCCAS